MHDGMGNARPEVLFVHSEPGLSVLLRNDGFSYQFQTTSDSEHSKADGSFTLTYHRIDVTFVGMNPAMSTVSKEHRHTNTHYREEGRKHVSEVYAEIIYRNVYEGVDIQFKSDSLGFKYNIICRDMNALARVRMRYDGLLGPLQLSSDNSFVLSTRYGNVEERIPVSLRCIGKDCVPCDVIPQVSLSGDEVYFHLPEKLKPGETLIIDPLPHRLWSTYSGGAGVDEMHQVDVDADGNIYVSGFTTSAGNIATLGAHQGTLTGFQNCFLMKYDADGQKIFGTYFGGQSSDRCYGMLHDSVSGHIYLSGSTFSSGLATAGTHQTTLASSDDGLIVKFDLMGNLVWATYYGGQAHDYIAKMALDSYGDIVMTGHTRSIDNIATDLTFLPGLENTFVAKFSSTGLHLWGTYYGGSFDEGWGIGLDGEDNIYISGITSSTTGISTSGAHQTNLGGGMDAFLAKYAPNGQLLWGTYYGGSADDRSNGLWVDADGSVLIIGNTSSATGISTLGSYQPQMGSIDDAFLARFGSDGSIDWGTYIGGGGVEYLYGIQADTDGGLLLAGLSESSDNVTSSDAFQPLPAGEYDALLMRFSSTGQFEWGTYLGGPLIDFANDVAIDPTTGHAIIAGMTKSTSGVSTSGAQNETYQGGQYDGFIARFCMPPVPVITAEDGLSVCNNSPLGFSLNETYPYINWNLGGSFPSYSFLPEEAGEHIIYVDIEDATGCPNRSDTLTVTVLEAPDLPFYIDINTEETVCLGTTITLTVTPQYAAQLWWNDTTDPQTEILLTDTLPHYLTVTVFDADGCSRVDSILVQAQLCTGTAAEGSWGEVKVYPNPSSGIFHVEWARTTDPFALKVYALDGRELYTSIAQQGTAIELPLASGHYLLCVENELKAFRSVHVIELIK